MKVLKFGGTSVGSEAALRSLSKIIKDYKNKGEELIIVSSAMGGVTNRLLQIGTDAANGKERLALQHEIRDLHLNTLHAFAKPTDEKLAILKTYFAEIQQIASGILAIREFSSRAYDLLLSYGERMAVEIVDHVLQSAGIKAVPIDARSLIRTDSEFSNAQVQTSQTNRLISSWYKTVISQKGSPIPVLTGFIASDKEGRTTTLGRGGSDLTASVIGASLKADEIEIWTDVDGFMTADPRLVPKAFTLEHLSYEEAMELSYFGAKVIYPPTMLPAVSKGIPIRIRNTFNPTHTGTRIHHSKSQKHNPESPLWDGPRWIKGITSIREISLITLQGGGMVGVTGLGSRLFEALAKAEVNVMLVTMASSEHSITFAVTPNSAPAAKAAIEQEFELEILQKRLEVPVMANEYSILAVVGENMKHSRGLSGRLFSALGRSGINVVAIAQGSSELNISVAIKASDLPRALNAVHNSLLLSAPRRLHVYIVGTGTVGSELMNQLLYSEDRLREEQLLEIKVMGIMNSRKMLFSDDIGLSLSAWQEDLDKKGQKSNLRTFIEQIFSQDTANKVFVDNTSNGDVASLYEELFTNHISVVTCNKIANSRSDAEFRRLRDTHRAMEVRYLYETNVGAGLPLIRTLSDLISSGDEVQNLEAILSGTISYIFNHYTPGRTFSEVVMEAQSKGYTEPDPRDDLSGMDFKRKMLILSRILGNSVEIDEIQMDPILPEACLKAPNVDAFYIALKEAEPHFASLRDRAHQKGRALRCIGYLDNSGKKKKLSIRVSDVDDSHPFFRLQGSDNVIAITTKRYHETPLVIKGPGAGATVTAAGVFSDLLQIGTTGR